MPDEEPIPDPEPDPDPEPEPEPVIYVIDSILTSIKKLLGIEESYTQFDSDIVIFINNAFVSLKQLGVGSTTGFNITGIEEEWADFLSTGIDVFAVKTFIYMKVRLAFDPPQNSYLVEAINLQIKESEWRLTNSYEEV